MYIIDKSVHADRLALDLLKCLGALNSHIKACQVKDWTRSTAHHLHNRIQSIKVDRPWPLFSEELDENYIPIPLELLQFLHTLVGGVIGQEVTIHRCELVSLSLAQDIIFTATNGETKPAKQILIALVV